MLLFLVSMAVGLLEGLFIFVAKSALSGAQWHSWSLPLLGLAGIVTLRTLAQIAATRLEMDGVFAWLAAQRSRLLEASAQRAFPGYREPWRNTLVTGLETGLEDLAQGIGAGFRCLASLAHLLALAPLLGFFSWKLAAGALALAVPAVLASQLRAGMLAAAGGRWSESKAALSVEAETFAEGLESHAGNGRLAEAAGRLGSGLDRHARRARAWETAKAVFPPALEWFFFMALAALALWTSGAHASDSVSPDPKPPGPLGLVPFGALLLLMYRPIREWARNYPIYLMGNRAWQSLGRLQTGLEAFPIRTPREASQTGSIRLEGLRFAYTGTSGGARRVAGPLVFSGLDLDFEPGELTWIAGRNGAGKSTLLKLLAGIEQPLEGCIFMPAGWPLASFAYLPQKAFLEPDWFAWAAEFRASRSGDWNRLDRILGLSSLLARGEDVTSPQGLSGGERQRLCLARVFASDAAFLLLDEPTTWLSAGDRERVLGDLLAFWRRPDVHGHRRGGALVSHEPFLGEFCSRTVRMDVEASIAPQATEAAGDVLLADFDADRTGVERKGPAPAGEGAGAGAGPGPGPKEVEV
ncbi:MAG: ATP-binding cassette domain-containing protein [Fibrobacteria bacterium]